MADDKRVAADFAEASRNLIVITGELKEFNMVAAQIFVHLLSRRNGSH